MASISLLSRPDEVLSRRLSALGLRPLAALRTHRNRTVMVSLSERLVLRLHQGYVFAPDRVLSAIVRFLDPRARRADRRRAERVFLAFPVELYAPRVRERPPERPRPGDLTLLHRLRSLHQRLNHEYFGGTLGEIPIRLSGRMRTRLGEVSVDLRTGRPIEIALSRRHLADHPWTEVEHTMLHEMVHQWQAESGRQIDHGPTFRRKAREVGVLPAARRSVARETGPAARRGVGSAARHGSELLGRPASE
ncbi:MAG TPA: SprT-like domain-containing protein [Gemmatimonadales bacterium]|nr:SprT-like domain-containing protein [Gemmatimonadales bacterium]